MRPREAESRQGADDREAVRPSTARSRKFRQAGFVYLHVGLLYEFAVWVLWRQGLLPAERGPGWVWLLVGALITLAIVWGLWRWQNVWFARAIWALHALRLPPLIGRAFLPEPTASLPADVFLAAIPIVLINLWMLARAGWDL